MAFVLAQAKARSASLSHKSSSGNKVKNRKEVRESLAYL